MRLALKMAAAAVPAMGLGILVGVFIGSFTLQHSWADPFVTISQSESARSASADADPTPPAGTKIIKAMPIGQVRLALAQLSAGDRLIARTGSVGASDDGFELHLSVENRGQCAVTQASGVAYAFDSRGRPAKVNKHGENYIAFTLEKLLAPGKKAVTEQKLRYAEDATLLAAHVDHFTCSDGSSWTRP